MTDQTITDARSDALRWQADARNRTGEPPPSAEDTHREAAQALGSPGAAVAVATLATTGLAPVPLDDDLQPSGTPLSTYQAVYEHYRNRHRDGVGVELGEHPGGVVLVAQRCTATAWQAWQRAEGAETRQRVNEYGRAVEEVSPLPLPRFVSLTWQAHAASLRSSGVHVGQEAITAAGRALGPDATPAEPGWVLYAVAPVDGRPSIFRDRKPDRHGVAVQATGIVPMYARRADGATLTASGTPLPEPLPDWLLVELGGRLGKTAR